MLKKLLTICLLTLILMTLSVKNIYAYGTVTDNHFVSQSIFDSNFTYSVVETDLSLFKTWFDNQNPLDYINYMIVPYYTDYYVITFESGLKYVLSNSTGGGSYMQVSMIGTGNYKIYNYSKNGNTYQNNGIPSWTSGKQQATLDNSAVYNIPIISNIFANSSNLGVDRPLESALTNQFDFGALKYIKIVALYNFDIFFDNSLLQGFNSLEIDNIIYNIGDVFPYLPPATFSCDNYLVDNFVPLSLPLNSNGFFVNNWSGVLTERNATQFYIPFLYTRKFNNYIYNYNTSLYTFKNTSIVNGFTHSSGVNCSYFTLDTVNSNGNLSYIAYSTITSLDTLPYNIYVPTNFDINDIVFTYYNDNYYTLINPFDNTNININIDNEIIKRVDYVPNDLGSMSNMVDIFVSIYNSHPLIFSAITTIGLIVTFKFILGLLY